METITFNGEHLLIGNLGHLFVVLSFVAALIGVFAFARHVKTENSLDLTVAKGAFFIHFTSVIGVIVALFSIIYNHYFEYQYAWQHSSSELPWYYMISCFWEGQEGSFLLWLFWEAVLGFAIILKPNEWRSPVMAVILLSQAVLSSMLLGIELPFIQDYKFGSSPFILLRNYDPSVLEIPVLAIKGIAKSDYLQVITNGTGLNPLLQNYWMVIHPPTLFFGFATTIIPFAFAIAGLWTRKYKEWMKPALPWALISVAVLGTGIIMGGIWAYESLSFGGYWAWDPVENASLVPWLVLIAGVHVMLINRITGSSLILSYLLTLGTFILVVYATFLTRSGVLEGSSVHTFTDLGLSRQLLVFLLMFMLLPVLFSFKYKRARLIYGLALVVIFIINVLVGKFIVWMNLLFILGSFIGMIQNFNAHLPLSKSEESTYSREFWMFVGSLVLLMSAGQIITTTSLPVLNKITSAFDWALNPLYDWTGIEAFQKMAVGNLDKPLDDIEHYNRYQFWFAIIIALLTAVTQFFSYKKSSKSYLKRNLLITLGLSVVLTVLLAFILKISFNDWIFYPLFLFAMSYAIVGNLWFMYKALRWKWKLSGASIAHIGFGLMLIGVLVSSANKHVISQNLRYKSYGANFSEQETRENIVLYKDQPFQMAEYQVTFKGDTTVGPNTYYEVAYLDTTNNDRFTLYPNAQYTEDQGLMPNPDTRHYLTKDVYTHVSLVPKSAEGEWVDDGTDTLSVGDTLFVNRAMVVLKGVNYVKGDSISTDLAGHELQIAELEITYGDSTVIARPVYGIKDNRQSYQIFSIAELAGIRVTYRPEPVNYEWGYVFTFEVQPPRYIVMKAIVFPFINLLWTGTVIMVIGFMISIRRRLKERK